MRTPITATQPPQQAANINNNVNHIARPNEAAAAAHQNPFLNLLNQTGLGNQQPTGTSTAVPSTASPTFATAGATMPPPFFFPSMPFIAPYTIPPPPMPQNLDQLSTEELRSMEGNERKHVEERLKLLKNVQTMLNASAALMNQYQMIVANLPPVPPSSSSTSQPVVPSPATVTNESEQKPSSSSDLNESQVNLEDIGSEPFLDLNNKLPTLSGSNNGSTTDSPATASTSEFIAKESSTMNGESEEANEIRRRRLQKFSGQSE